MPKQPYNPASRGTGKPYTRPQSQEGRPYRSQGASSAPPSRRYDPTAPRPRPQGRSNGPQKVALKSTSLDLSNKALEEPPKDEDLAGLTKLNLTSCQLTSISFVGASAATLTWLNVSGNVLNGCGAWAGVEQLKGLFVLNASNCGLTEVPACVASLSSLKALVLSHNSITKLQHVSDLPDLNTIVVSNNALTALPSSLATLPALKKISAAHNQLTPGGLPDLSSLSHLSELRLNDNPALSSLPYHFGAWGKAPLTAAEEDEAARSGAKRQKGRQGLEILDLGNCGFESWMGLKELAKQSAIVNLGLKGNKVTADALEEEAFDELKSKLTVLLPSLRILDNNRFDAKFADLKARRAARTDEQKVLDAGPMGLAINSKLDTPVEISREALRDRERIRENKRRKKAGLPEVTKEDEEEKARVKAERKKEREEAYLAAKAAAGPEKSDQEDEAEEGAAKPAKRDKGKKRERDGEPVGPVERAGEKRKRGRRTKEEREKAALEGNAVASTSAAAGAAKGKKVKGPRAVGGSLSAVAGEEVSAPTSKRASPPPASPAAPAPDAPDAKPVKTSVAKIIEVKGKKGKKGDEAKKEDIGALLGLLGGGSKVEEEKEEASNSGLFGGGGWD